MKAKDLKDKKFWKMVAILTVLSIGIVGILVVAWWLVIENGMHP